MHEETNQSALELRLKQVIRYSSLALVGILALCLLLFMYIGSVKQSEAVAQNNQQAQAQIAIDSNVCKVYPEQDLCIMARKIAQNPDEAIIPKDGLNGKDGTNGKNGVDGSNGTDGRGVKTFDQKSGNLIVTYTDNQKQDLGRVVGKDGINGKDGAAGAKGDPGASGTAGTAGAAGSDGANGTDGRGVTSSDVKDGHLIVTYTDGTVQDAGIVVGPKGEPGDPSKYPSDISTDTAGNVTITYNDGSKAQAGRVILPTLLPLICEDGDLTVQLSNGAAQSVAADCSPDNAPTVPGLGN